MCLLEAVCDAKQPFNPATVCAEAVLFVYKPQESAAESARVLLESSITV